MSTRDSTPKSTGKMANKHQPVREFGSDFHFIQVCGQGSHTIGSLYPRATYFADGRQALIALYQQMGWKRLWVPSYFCYEVLESMIHQGVNLAFYDDYPMSDENRVVLSLPYQDGDALVRVNYFGLRSWRSNVRINVPVVEDHTHDLLGGWAANSDADWCIASLRKTLPLAEGGMLWSPKGYQLNEEPELTDFNKRLASVRWNAMRKKSMYLDGMITDKNEFRQDMMMTEGQFDTMATSALDEETRRYLERLDVMHWYQGKNANWAVLKDICSQRFTVMEPEDPGCYPFSLILLLDSESERNSLRKSLIDNNIYPAILWSVPGCDNNEVNDFSSRMLSIHCDSRYDEGAMKDLGRIIVAI